MGHIKSEAITKFIVDAFTTTAIQEIVLLLLEELVKRTETDIDDKIYEIIAQAHENRGKWTIQ